MRSILTDRPMDVKVDVVLEVIASDASTTFVHSSDTIIKPPTLKWSMPYGGGLATPGSYKIDISLPLEDIKERLPLYRMGEAALKIYVNSDNFTPFIGKVRSIDRDGTDLNRMRLTVIDKLFDDNPTVPKITLADSWTPHPEDVGMGYPLFYGDTHDYPLYMMAVDSGCAQFLGPRNITQSGERGINALFYWQKDQTNDYLFTANGSGWWTAENSGNLFTPAEPFEITTIRDGGSGREVTGESLFEFAPPTTGMEQRGNYWFQSWNDFLSSAVDTEYDRYGAPTTGTKFAIVNENPSVPVSGSHYPTGIRTSPAARYIGRYNYARLLPKTNDINYTTQLSFGAFVTPNNPVVNNMWYRIVSHIGSSYLSGYEELYSSGASSGGLGGFSGTWTVANSRSNAALMFTQSADTTELIISTFANSNFFSGSYGFYSAYISTEFSFSLKSSAYKRYSVYEKSGAGYVPASAGIAISDNPFTILDHVCSYEVGIPFRQDQSSDMADLSVWTYRCFFGEPKPFTDIVNEFCAYSRVGAWLGDSGFLNYVKYNWAESSTAQDIININDCIGGELSITDNPLGVTAGGREQYSNFEVSHEYDFSQDKYQFSTKINPSNNSKCESADAAGITSTLKIESKYIRSGAGFLAADLAWLHAQAGEVVSVGLPAWGFAYELGDVLTVNHPSIVGSTGLYQIIDISHNYATGKVAVKAEKTLPG